MYLHKIQLFSNFLALGERLPISRFISSSSVRPINQKWRRERGYPMNPNASGVLTDEADYSFVDGRPTPYGVRQRERITKQRELTEKIIALTKEIDFAVIRHKRLQSEEAKARQRILDSKLKPKGKLLLEK